MLNAKLRCRIWSMELANMTQSHIWFSPVQMSECISHFRLTYNERNQGTTRVVSKVHLDGDEDGWCSLKYGWLSNVIRNIHFWHFKYLKSVILATWEKQCCGMQLRLFQQSQFNLRSSFLVHSSKASFIKSLLTVVPGSRECDLTKNYSYSLPNKSTS